MSTAALDIKVPFIVTCQVTGLQKAYTSKDFVLRKIANYGGDVQNMLDTYVCKDAKKLLREGKSVEEVIKLLNGTKDPKTVDVTKLVLVKKVKVTKAEKPAADANDATRAAAKKSKKEKAAPKAKAKKSRAKKEKTSAAPATETPAPTAPAADAPATTETPAPATETPSEQPATA
jgi:hypothetical protein